MAAAPARITRRPALLSTVCAVLAVLLLAAGGIFMYLRIELLNADSFGDRAVEAVRHKEVRRAVAERIVTTAIDRGSPDLVAARPLLRSAVEVVIRTPAFEGLVRAAARQAHRVLFDTKKPTVAVDVADAQRLILPALKSVDPDLADELPRRLDPTIAKLDERAFATDTIQLAQRARLLGILLPLLGLAALVGAVLLAPDRSRALRTAPLAFTAAAALVVLVTELSQPEAAHAVGRLSDTQIDAAVGEVWSALVGDLETWALWLGIGGLAVTLFASPWADEVAAPLRAGARALLAPASGRRVRAVRGAALFLAGVLVLLASSDLVRAVGLGLGGLVAATGLADLIGAAAGPLRRRPEPAVEDENGGRAVGAVAAVALAAALGVVVLVTGGDAAKRRAAQPITSCNGLKQLCGRRLNEAFFPGTHNSMSAGDSPGWLFVNQRRDIPRQLDDGIRLFLIDLHWGVRRPDGRIRTDLEAEGTDRNRVAKALGGPAVQTAERLAGRVGLGNLKGKREVYFCHTLCELGSTPVATVLGDYRRFLDDHPDQLVVLFLEPSVPSWAVRRELGKAGLFKRVAEVDRDRPLPTLGSLLRRGKQLVILGERDTGGEPWYLDGFSFVQDTPLGKAAATSCADARGDPTSPIVMINHWVDGFPPRPSANRPIETRARLLERVRRCERKRGVRPTFMAVDHYEQGKIVSVARELNSR